jgi:hypothetical protein
MSENNFQRVGATSNTHVGKDFQGAVRQFFSSIGLDLKTEHSALVGFVRKKEHKFDLGSDNPPVLVECKSYTWTSGGNSPSAKIRGLNEAMLLFAVAPFGYRKILVALRHMRKGESLLSHYIKTQGHLIGPGVEIWEFDDQNRTCNQVL